MSDNIENIEVETLADNMPTKTQKIRKVQEDEEPPKRKTQKPLVSEPVTVRKRGFGKRVKDTLIDEDHKSVGSYILVDVIVPTIKDLIFNAISGALEMSLFGDRRANSNARGPMPRGGYVSYGNYYNDRNRAGTPQREVSRVGRARHEFDEIVINNRGEAEDILQHLFDRVRDYQVASVADFYELVGINPVHTDFRYGWHDLRGSYVERLSRNRGYILNLPRTVPIDV